MAEENNQEKLETIDKVFRDDPNDDRPLGGGKKFQIPEFADGESPPDLPPPPKKKVVNNKFASKAKQNIESTENGDNQDNYNKESTTQKSNTETLENNQEEGFEKIDKPIRDDPNDDRPLGGGKKFQIPEFADGEQPPEVKPKAKVVPKRFAAKAKEDENTGEDKQVESSIKQETKSASSTSDDKPWLKKIAVAKKVVQDNEEFSESINIDEKPIGGGKKPAFDPDDERPLGGGSNGTYNLDDERPLGGGNKSAFNPDDERPVGGAKKNNFMDEDERPVGGAQKNTMMDEYPQGMDPNSIDDSAQSKDDGPLNKRIVHKVVKTRMNAFSELAQELEKRKKDTAFFSEYESGWDKMISDSNPSCQEQACIALKNWIQFHPNFKNLKIPDCVSILKALIEKCIGGGKPQVLAACKDLVCLLYEKCSDQTEFFDGLNACVKNKNSKVGVAGIQCIIELLTNYGPKKFDYMKPFFGEIENSIRQECMNFFKEAQKWLGDAIVKNYTKNLKKLQQDELEKFYSEWDKQPMVPLRASEEEKKAAANKAASGGGAGGGAAGGGELDLYEIADAIDIFVKYSDKWCDKVLALSKWQEKKENLDEIITAASQPKVAPGNYMPVVGMIKRLLNDNNSNVQLNSIKLTGCLCKSIRKGFNMGAKQLFDQIIIKFRDKKTLIIEETKSAIDNFWFAMTLEEVIEEIKEGLMDKAPPMKMQVMQAIERYFDTKPSAVKSRDAFKSACIPTIKKLFDDSNSEVREYCLKWVGKLNGQKGWFTSEEINNLTSGLNDQKKAKISQGGENLGESQLANSKLVQKPGASASAASSKVSKPQEEEEEVKETKSFASTIKGGGVKKPAAEKVTTGGSSSAGNNSAGNDEDVSSSSIPSADECEERLKENGMPEEYTKLFAGTKNPDKVEALQAMGSSDYFEKNLLELLVYLDKVAFKSSILVVQKEILTLVENAVQLNSFNKKCFHVITDFLIKYIGEVKFNSQVNNIIEKACERLMPKYVLSRLIRVLKQDEKKMSPKSAQELSKTIARIIDLSTLKYVNFMDVLTFAKESIQNTNVSIKGGGQEILKKLYEHMGETLSNNFLKDVPANIMGTLTKEFSKLTVLSDSDKNSSATMKFVGDAGKEVAQAAASGKGASSNPLDQLPRADISKDAEKLLKKLTDAQWKTRKEGLDELDKIMAKSNNRIQISGLFDLLGILKQTLQESNKGLQRQAFNFIGRFAEACGKDFKPHSKNILCQVISNLSNKETLMRKEVIQALDRFEKAIGGEAVINNMPSYLLENNPEQRSGIIEWILRHPESYAISDLTAFVSPILNCLDDKSKEIRGLAEQLLEKTISVTTAEPFKYAFKDMKPATVKAIQPIIAKYTNLDDDGDVTPAVTRTNNKTGTQIGGAAKAGDKNIPKIVVQGSKTTAPGSKTLQRTATVANIKTSELNSDTSINNGDKTPGKSKYGLNHSLSTNKLNPKDLTSTTNNVKSGFSVQSTTQNSQNQLEDFTQTSDKIQMQQSQIQDLQQQLEASKQQSTMANSQISTASGNRLTSMVDQSAKRQLLDDSMIFPLSNSITSLKQKRLNFPLQQGFNIQNPSNEHFDFIQNEIRFLLNPSITPLMFSFNYRSLIQATDQIKSACDDLMQQASLKYLSDLLFQWCFMRIYGNFNIEVCLHLLDTIRTILIGLQKQSEQLSDLEIGTINASIRECLINLPESSSILQQIYVITNIQLKILAANKDKVIHFWLNQLMISVGELHPQYFESDTLNHDQVQSEYLNKLYDLFTKVFLKSINPTTSLNFLSSIPFKTPKAIAFILAVQEQFGRDALIQAGFIGHSLEQYAEANKQVQQSFQSPGFPVNQSFNQSIYNNNQQKLVNANTNNSSQVNSNNVSSQSIQSSQSKQNETPSFNKQQTSTAQQQQQQQKAQSTQKAQPQQQQQQQQQQPPSLEEQFVSKVNSLKKDPYSNDKVDMLVYINNMIQEYENPNNMALIENNTNLLLDMIYSQLKYCFENKKVVSPQYLQYFLNVMYKCFTIKNFAKNCKYETLKNFTEEILYRLLSEDENQTKEESAPAQNGQLAGNSIIKLINSTMLRILENSRPEYVYKILLELLIKYRQQFNYAKILGLIIKCILKVTKGLSDFINQINLNELLLYFHSYICEFLVPNPTMSDDIGVKTIKTILKELCKLKGDAIWDIYNNSIKNHPQKDQFISEWIGLVLKPTQTPSASGNPISIISPRDLRFERKISSTQQSFTNLNPDQIDLAISKTIESIKKSDTFEHGIAQLHEILTKNPNINVDVYLQDCTQNFTKFVINNLEKYDQQKKATSASGIPNTSQLYNAAYNFSQTQNQNDDSRIEDKLNNSTSQGVGKQMDYENLHNRINEFKQRIIRRDQQFNDLENIQQINQQSQLGDKSFQQKTSEEFMQKVIDMKAKRQNHLSQNSFKDFSNAEDQERRKE